MCHNKEYLVVANKLTERENVLFWEARDKGSFIDSH